MFSHRVIYALIGVLIVGIVACSGQDYDDEGYGPQGGGNNQGDADNYGGGYGNEDGYNNNMPNYQQNVDTEGSNNNPNNYNPQGGNDADGDYENDDGSAAAASSVVPSVTRIKRSTGSEQVQATKVSIKDEQETLKSASSEPKLRVKRHGKHYIGPVYTYVKTDKHANFKWGVKHKVGKKHHG